MNSAAVLSVLAAVLGATLGALTLRASRAPGWRELRWLSVVTFLAAAHALSGLAFTLPLPGGFLPLAARLAQSLDLAILFAFGRYAEDVGQGAAPRWTRAIELVVLLAGLAALLLSPPGDPKALSLLPEGAPALRLALLAVPGSALVATHLFLSRRRDVPFAFVNAAAFLALILLSALDLLTAGSRVELPRVLDLGFLLPVGLIGWTSALRFLNGADDLAALRLRLESLVEERTRALIDTREVLLRSERLASLGQLANGVAHQVSNPASVVTANLRYLSENVVKEAEDREVADDALAAMQRINHLVRRLADAGRVAVEPRASTAVELGAAVRRAVEEARPSLPDHVELDALVPSGLHVRTRVEVLEQVLQSLLANAADALPKGRPGRIKVRAERRGDGIRLTVSDDGVGMGPEVLERAFEPFFTTKPPGEGSGLGLPISRGMVEMHGGALWLESTPQHGTTAVLVLPGT